jgi:hypothetical protein
MQYPPPTDKQQCQGFGVRNLKIDPITKKMVLNGKHLEPFSSISLVSSYLCSQTEATVRTSAMHRERKLFGAKSNQELT